MKTIPRCLLGAALAALPGMAADHFPEDARDSQPILDEQYRQMDRYFEQQIAQTAEIAHATGAAWISPARGLRSLRRTTFNGRS